MKAAGIVKAFHNLPGVEVVNVRRLNLLLLAPGGHTDRFVLFLMRSLVPLTKLRSTRRTSRSFPLISTLGLR